MRALTSLFAIVAIMCAGCAATSTPLEGPNKKPGHYVRCGSALLDACYREAARVCPSGYSVVDRQGGGSQMYTLFVECKG